MMDWEATLRKRLGEEMAAVQALIEALRVVERSLSRPLFDGERENLAVYVKGMINLYDPHGLVASPIK